MVDVRDATLNDEVLGEGPAALLLHRGGNNHLMGGEVRRTVPGPSGDPVGHAWAGGMAGRRATCRTRTPPGMPRPGSRRTLVAAPAVHTSRTVGSFRHVVDILRHRGRRQAVVDRDFAPDAAERIPEQVHLYRKLNALNPPFPRDAFMPGLRRAVVPVGDLAGFGILTLVTAGRHDQMLTFDTVSEVAELVPSADFAIHAGDGHAQMIEDPDGFLDLVGPWLHKHD